MEVKCLNGYDERIFVGGKMMENVGLGEINKRQSLIRRIEISVLIVLQCWRNRKNMWRFQIC